MRRQDHGARRGEPGRVEGRRLVRRDRHRQRPRLRSGLGEVPRAQDRAELPQRRALDPAAQLAVELLLQPHRPLRLRRPRGGQGDLLRRRDAAVPGAELRLPGGRRGLGVHALRRPDRPLGEAQPARRSRRRIRATSTRPAARLRAEVRARGAGGGGAPGRGARGRLQLDPDRRRRGPRRLLPLQDRAQERHPRSVRAALLLRLRGRRSDQRLGLRPARPTRSARASTRSSARTSATSTCPT